MEGSNLNAIGVTLLLLMAILALTLPRRFALVPIFMSACFMTFGQNINIAGATFYFLRIIVLFTWIRVIFRRETLSIKLNAIDKTIICWVIINGLAYTLLRQTSDALINRLGFAYDVFGFYFIFRILIRDFADIEAALKFLSFCIIGLASIIFVEYTTGKNPFAILGAVPEVPMFRGMRPRCQGPFGHPILVGSFGASFIPWALLLWFRRSNTRLVGLAGLAAGTFIMIASGSSGPVITGLASIVGLLMWRYREHLRKVRWGIAFAILSLHVVMKAPVWHLIARVSAIFGSGHGWYRARLIDRAIQYFEEWWLLGTKNTSHWMPFTLSSYPSSVDITNQYIKEGVTGGILTLVLFISIIVLSFREVGLGLSEFAQDPFWNRLTVWTMGCVLFAHVITFFGVSYFDQIKVFWFLLLALISTICSLRQARRDSAGELQDK